MSRVVEPLENVDDRATRVLAALADERWDFRTTDGISAETNLSEGEVKQILEDDSNRQWVGKSSVPDPKGRELYYLKTRGQSGREFLRRLRMFASKTLG